MNNLLTELESKISYTFTDAILLETALTHSSFANELSPGEAESNERFEFLGDAVLGQEIALLVFETGEQLSAGEMTQVRAGLVRTERLAEIAREMELGSYLRLGIGAGKTDVRENDSVLEDSLEALIAAVYLDGGACAARRLIRGLFAGMAETLVRDFPESVEPLDYKSRLQVVLQSKGPANIRYTVLEESGPDHDKHFHVAVMSGGRTLGTGSGKTKKNAEQKAAKMALEDY